jgi:hypothetical protein
MKVKTTTTKNSERGTSELDTTFISANPDFYTKEFNTSQQYNVKREEIRGCNNVTVGERERERERARARAREREEKLSISKISVIYGIPNMYCIKV